MTWRLTIRLFGNKPDGLRNPVTFKHELEDLNDVGQLMGWASREGEIIYAFIEPQPGWLDQFDVSATDRATSRRVSR